MILFSIYNHFEMLNNIFNKETCQKLGKDQSDLVTMVWVTHVFGFYFVLFCFLNLPTNYWHVCQHVVIPPD